MGTDPKNDKTTTNMDSYESIAMGKQDRKLVVLAFLHETDLVLKASPIYRNLKFHRRITFEDQTVRNILHELTEEGYVRRVDIQQIPNGELVDVDSDNRKGGYVITDKGREVVQSGGFQDID
jgi:Fe2+ or Zn2+ uptake regulation protein